MGGTSREGFLEPPSRGYFYDSDKNGNISSEVNCQADHLVEYGDGKESTRLMKGSEQEMEAMVECSEKIIYDV